MRSNTAWILAIVLGLILVLGLPFLLILGGFWPGGYGGMMGSWGHMGRFGFLAMLLMWLVPLGLFILAVAVGAFLLNVLSRSNKNQAEQTSFNCPNCNKPIQVDWNICPYCGKPLK